jgi:hypothetical protein
MAGTQQKTAGLAAWVKRRRLRVQAVALAITVGGSFGLFWALNAGQGGLAAVCFGVVAISMAVTMGIS